ncbi:MAG: C40 family peptidase [Lachnospiraceae bacterium]|nr:C40 family peptidase [Lachnospiraceae bacterium]
MKIKVDTSKLLMQTDAIGRVKKRLQVIADSLGTLGSKNDWDDIYDGIAESIKHDVSTYSANLLLCANAVLKFSSYLEKTCNNYDACDLEIREGKIIVDNSVSDTMATSEMIKSASVTSNTNMDSSTDTIVDSDKISSADLTESEKVIKTAIDWAHQIADDDKHHGYSQTNRGKEQVVDGETIVDYDCSSFVCTAYKEAGIEINPLMDTRTMAANGCAALLNAGFTIVTDKVNLQTGEGLKEGDILLTQHIGVDGKRKGHVEIVTKVNEKNVEITGAHSDKDGKAGDSGQGKEINTRKYHYDGYDVDGNKLRGYEETDKWDYVLRYDKK